MEPIVKRKKFEGSCAAVPGQECKKALPKLSERSLKPKKATLLSKLRERSYSKLTAPPTKLLAKSNSARENANAPRPSKLLALIQQCEQQSSSTLTLLRSVTQKLQQV